MTKMEEIDEQILPGMGNRYPLPVMVNQFEHFETVQICYKVKIYFDMAQKLHSLVFTQEKLKHKQFNNNYFINS